MIKVSATGETYNSNLLGQILAIDGRRREAGRQGADETLAAGSLGV